MQALQDCARGQLSLINALTAHGLQEITSQIVDWNERRWCPHFIYRVAHAELLDREALSGNIAGGVCQVADQESAFYIQIVRDVFDATLAMPLADAVRAGELHWQRSLFGGLPWPLAQLRAGTHIARDMSLAVTQCSPGMRASSARWSPSH